MTELDQRLTKLLVDRRLATGAQVEECVAEQLDISRAGLASVPLSEVLIAHGLVTREQVEELLAAADAAPASPKSTGRAAVPAPPNPVQDDFEATLMSIPSQPAAEPGPAPARSAPEAPVAVDPRTGMPADASAAAEEPMNSFGNYVLISLVGRGSLGKVWKAWDRPGKRYAALKLLKDTSKSPEVLGLLTEARRAAKLDHANIGKVFEAGTRDGAQGKFDTQHYVAMEFVDGKTLEQYRDERITHKRAAELTRDIARALDAAHAEGILHRDLKPHNVLVRNSDGAVRVTDFGLARLVDLDPMASAELSRTGRIIGTPAYMPPEQAVGRTHDFSARSDVYAIGATLYFLLTGKPPFEGKSHFEICFKVVREDLAAPTTHDPTIPPDLERIVLRSMAKDPVRRYDTARAMADDLDRFVKGAAIVSDDELRFTQGLAALSSGRLEEAVHMFRELMLLESGRGALGAIVAGRDAVMQKLNEGEAGMNLAIERQTKNYNIRSQRGIIRFGRAIMSSFEKGDPKEDCKNALDDFDQACLLTNESVAARVNRANLLLFTGRFARDKGRDISPIFKMALDELTQAIKFDESYSAAFHNRGIVHFYMGMEIARAKGDPKEHFFQAIDDFSVAAHLEPTYAYVFKDLGVVKVALAKFLLARGERPKDLLEQAVEHLSRAIKLQSRLQGAYFERGMAYFALKRFEESIADWMRCIDLDPSKRKQVEPYLAEARAKLTARRQSP